MTKYFVMRECEDIPTRNLYAVTQHLLTRRNFYFKIPQEVFRDLLGRDLTSFYKLKVLAN